MANEVLKQVFQDMHAKIVDGVNPNSLIDVLFAEKVIGIDDFRKLRQIADSRERCRELLLLLHSSSHPQALIRLRLALLDEYSWIVDEIDKKLPSLISQLQQLPPGDPTDEEKRHILPRSSDKNQLQEALADGRFDDASRLIESESEAYLVECFEGVGGCLKSCLHVIAAISDMEQATKLCRELMQKVNDAVNREYLLHSRTVEKFDMGGWKVHVRVAAIHIAAHSGNSGVVRILCEDYGVDVNCSTSETLEEEPKKGMTPLEWAARKGHLGVVKILLDNEANVNAGSHTNGVTAMHIAAQNGHVEVVKLLLENNADLSASIKADGTTALHIAAWNGHAEVVRLLLENGAEVNASCTDDDVTALFIAAQNGHAEVVKVLLDNKADLNPSFRTGSTALHAAAQNGHADVVKLLLDNEAYASRLRDGATALVCAVQGGHVQVVKTLLQLLLVHVFQSYRLI